jgi:hypothetical protein
MELDPTQFELRGEGADVEWRENVPNRPWRKFTSGSVYCIGCAERSAGSDHVVYDPRTGELLSP